jgi:serine/threonine protein kinase
MVVPTRPSVSAHPPVLEELLQGSFIAAPEWDRLPAALQEDLRQTADSDLLPALIEHGLLTPFQARRLATGQRHGLILGDYRVLDRIGTGSNAVIFAAEHLVNRRPVALKVLTVADDEDRRVVQRFVQELRIATRVRHPSIVRAVGAGAAHGPEGSGLFLLYVAMEFVGGMDLEEWVRTCGPMSLVQTVDVAMQLASALAEMWQRHLVHRDVNPKCVRLTPEGQVKLVDFGLARWSAGLDEPGKPLGTLPYMAPEQVHHADKVDIRADLYGLGGTLYWCLTGQPPFKVLDNALSQLAARLHQLPPSPRAVRSEVLEDLDAIVQRLLALQPADRFRSPVELLAALQALQENWLNPPGATQTDINLEDSDPLPIL